MEEKGLDTKTVQIATQVIIHAGNARMFVNEAINQVESGDFSGVEKNLDKAEEEITAAHAIQTDIIQSEARGEELQLSMLMTHAQDVLMSASIELHITRRFLKLIHMLLIDKNKPVS